MKRILLSILVVGVLLLSACGAPTTAPPTEAPPTPPPTEQPAPVPQIIEITAAQLYAEYEANEIAADQKYKNKMLKVTGVLSSISKDILGSPYIVLTGGGEYEVWGVQCTFSSAYEPQLAKLTKGQQVTVTGKCKGYLINVLLEVK